MIKDWVKQLNEDGQVKITKFYYDRIVAVLQHKDGKYIVEDSGIHKSNDGFYLSTQMVPITLSFYDEEEEALCDDNFFNPLTDTYEDCTPMPEGFQYEEAVHVHKLYHFTSIGCPNLIPFKSEVLCLSKVMVSGIFRHYINQHVVGKCPFKLCD